MTPTQDADRQRLSRFGAPSGRALAADGARYSKYVRILRLALPLVAIGIVGLLLSWPRVEATMEPVPREAVVPDTVGKNELVNPRFESTDEKNQPFTVTATRAVQSARDPSVVLLESPAADITLTDGTILGAAAARGAYRQNADRLLLQGNVTLTQNEGYEVVTDKLLVNLKNREAWSDAPVAGRGPAGTLAATGLQAHGESGRLVFTGPVRLVLNRRIGGME